MNYAIGANIRKDSERLMPRGRFIRGREHEPRGQNGVRQFPHRRLAACRALKNWEAAEEIARTLIKREPENIMHVVALVHEFAGERAGTPGNSGWLLSTANKSGTTGLSAQELLQSRSLVLVQIGRARSQHFALR